MKTDSAHLYWNTQWQQADAQFGQYRDTAAEQIEAFLKPLCTKLAQGAGAQYRVEWLNKAED